MRSKSQRATVGEHLPEVRLAPCKKHAKYEKRTPACRLNVMFICFRATQAAEAGWIHNVAVLIRDDNGAQIAGEVKGSRAGSIASLG